MTFIKLLAAAGDWAAGDLVHVEDKQAERLIRTGYAEPSMVLERGEAVLSRDDVAAMTGMAPRLAKRKEKVH